MDKATILGHVNDAVLKGKTRFPTWSGYVHEVMWFDKGRVAGRAYPRSKSVSFNLILAARAGRDFIDTIYHEIAHLITSEVYPYAKQAHGPEFKHVMRVLGYSPSTYHNYDTTGLKQKYTRTRYVYTCSCKEHHVSAQVHNKITKKGATYKCASCGTKIEFTGKARSITK